MKRTIPVIRVTRETLENLMKSRAGLVQQRVWVKDSGNKKGHWRMQWVQPGTGKTDATAGQMDLFGGDIHPKVKPAEKKAEKKPEPDKPQSQAMRDIDDRKKRIDEIKKEYDGKDLPSHAQIELRMHQSVLSDLYKEAGIKPDSETEGSEISRMLNESSRGKEHYDDDTAEFNGQYFDPDDAGNNATKKMNDAGTEDDGKGLMRKRREELVRKISATKEKLKTLDKTGEEAKTEKDKLKLMKEILQEFDDELSGKDSEATNGRKPKFELVKKQGSYHAKDPEALLSMSEDDFRRAFAEKYKKEYKKRSTVEDLMKQTKGPEYAWGIRDLLELKKFNSPKELLEQYKKYSNVAHPDALSPLTIGLHYALDDLQKKGVDVKNDDLEIIRDGWPRDAKFNEAVERFLRGSVKKSVVDLFREGLAKAFGATHA